MSEWVREVLLNQIGEPAGHDVVLRLTRVRFEALRRRATDLGGRDGHRAWQLHPLRVRV